MVPFDSRSPFQTSGLRIGTPAVTSRGFVEKDMLDIVELIDSVLASAAYHAEALAAKEPTEAQQQELAGHRAVLAGGCEEARPHADERSSVEQLLIFI